MRALVYEAPNLATLSDVEPPEIGDGGALIRLRALGICHSDFDLLTDRYILPIDYPVIPGHEWVGEVVEVAPGVTAVGPGDRVVGECAIADDVHFGFTMDGAGSELFAVSAAWLHRIPDTLDDTMGALVEPFTVAYAATSGVDAGDDVVIFGAGPIGLCSVAAAVGRGANVIMIEPSPQRREIAVSMGAFATVDPGSDQVQAVEDLTEGGMASFVVEASGNPTAMAATLEVAGYGARLVNVGINVGDTAPALLGLIMGKALTIRGQVGSVGVWSTAIRFLERTGVDLSPLVSTRFELDDAVEALTAAHDRQRNIKVHIVNPQGAGST